jgi:hypothetical protein
MLKKATITLVLSFAMTLLMVSCVAITAYAADEQKTQGTMALFPALRGEKDATPTGPALLPSKPPMVLKSPPGDAQTIHNPAGSQMLVARLTIVPVCDGSIDATEWSDAYMYDVSDTSGQQDGIPDPLGTVTLWLKQDDIGVYFAIRNNVDQTLDENDQVGLYFDDNHDGCFPASPTNEGNNWLVYQAAGSYVQWRWIQDFDCGFPPNYVCTGDNYGGYYNWSPTCFGIGIGPTGVVDYEVMIPYGVIDEYLDLTMPPDSLGFYMYCLDYATFVFNGEWPSQYNPTTYNEPCYYGHLICETTEEWPNHKMHFPQLPDLEGWDVYAVFPKTLADDWQCSATGEVLDIHFWGSWKDIDGDPYTDDYLTPMPWFQLSIHLNIPADADSPWSRPGEQVWFWEGEIPGTPFEPPAMEHWFNPNTGEVLYNDHVPYWRYDFFFDQADPPPEPFFQYEDTIYWLNVSAMYIEPPYEWGWKSSRDHFMDDATYTDNPPDGPWDPLFEPPRANWFDFMFGPDGVPEDLGSTNYYGQGWYQYEYWWNMWFYNNPFVYQPKHIWLEFYVNLPYPHSYAEFAINWSTDLWSLEGEPGRPPLPGDDETLYIGRQIFTVVDGFNTIDFWIDDYNPEWVSIDFVAVDAMINGWIWHECVQTSMDMAFVITGEEVPTGPNHYKTWVFAPLTSDSTVFVQDQFMDDSLYLLNSVLLSNPVKKVVDSDTFDIIRPDDHLTWYRAFGRDTLIQVEYVNQFESTTVVIDIVEWLLVPTQKEDHAPPENLDHYKAYNIQNPVEFPVVLSLEDQFDVMYGEPEYIESLSPRYFLTPAIKNMEQPQMFDSVTHYVAYEIFPHRSFPLTVYSWDQFGEHYLTVFDSWYLLVPSTKRIAPPCYPPNIGCPSDEIQNANGVYTTTTQWTADDGNPTDPTVELISVAVQPPLPPGISAANVNFLGPVPGPGLGVKSTWGTVTYTVADHCQSGGNIVLIATNNCPPPNNSATCTFNVTLTNDPPTITQPDFLEGFVDDTVEYDITGNDPNGDIIHDTASIQIVPGCGTYSITRTAGHGTSSGTWQITWYTDGCTPCDTHMVIHDLTDTCGATSYCTTKVHLSEERECDPNDPYDCDTLWVECGNMRVPPGGGLVTVDMTIANDESLKAIQVILSYAGSPTCCDSMPDSENTVDKVFAGSVIEDWELKAINIDHLAKTVSLGATPIMVPCLPPGKGHFATLTLFGDSCCTILLDTTTVGAATTTMFTECYNMTNFYPVCRIDTCHIDRNNPPIIDQPDFLEGLVDDVVEYTIDGTDPDGDVIEDDASIDIQPGCGSGYSITRISGHGTSTGTWEITWNTDGCTPCDTHMVIHDLTDVLGATAYCTTWVHLVQPESLYWKPPYEDYAPNGMPDIDQKQDGWRKGGTDQWSFCGPAAVANCFKWFDSKYNVPPGAPGDGFDQFPLVRDYLDNNPPHTGFDDHDPWNVDHTATPWGPAIGPPPPTPQPFVPGPQTPNQVPPWGELVERLAWYFNTDGIQTGYCEFTGTKVEDMQAGIDDWLRSETFTDGSSLFDTLCEVTTRAPTFAYVESLVEKCEDVILLLGFWFQENPQEFIRGDLNQDGVVNLPDIISLLQGPPYLCDDAADINDDGILDLDSDSTYFWNYIYWGGPPPPPPFPDCGPDPTWDRLGCAQFLNCPPPSGPWYRIGGHYVTVAGVNSETHRIAFSDPFIDAAEFGAPGRIGDGVLILPHTFPHDPTVHNDEGNVSHDIYTADTESVSPGGVWWLPGYAINGDAGYWSWNFYAQNVPDEFVDSTAVWNGVSPIHTEVEYCVHISPWDYRGDVNIPNGDGTVNIADVVFLSTYLFLSGPAPIPYSEGDVTCDGIVNIADVVFLATYLFLNGPPPRCCDP